MSSFRGTDRFELVRQLGEGGMGIVYEVFDRERELRVALKTLRQLDAASLYRFKREFRALTDVSHPNIIALHELVSSGDDWFLTMEIVDGVDFLAWVRQPGWAARTARSARSAYLPTHVTPARGREGEVGAMGSDASRTDAMEADAMEADASRTDAMGTDASRTDAMGMDASRTDVTRPDGGRGAGDALDVDRTLPGRQVGPVPGETPMSEVVDEARLRSALRQLAEALEVLHRADMVHRDLKPSNVRVTPRGRVVLMDFGIVAEMLQETSDELSGVEGPVVGTPSFMAPEQAAGEPPTPASDWYGFGVMLYLALCGRLPFSGASEYVLLAKQSGDAPPPSQWVTGIPAELDLLCRELLSREPSLRPRGAEVLARLGGEAPGAHPSTPDNVLRSFVGRDEELAALRRAAVTARAGRTACVLVEGPSGMGKSTLMRRFFHELAADAGPAPVVLRGRCHERESVPYKAFDGIIDHLSRVLLAGDEARVAELLPHDIDLLPRLFPVLRRVPGVQRARPQPAGVAPQELRTRAFATLRELLARLGRARLLVLAIDDLQWADRDSLELLDELLRPPGGPPLLLCATLRAENLGADRALAEAIDAIAQRTGATRLRLAPLSETEQRTVVERMLGAAATPERIADPLWRESEGNPLFLGELVRWTREQKEPGAGVRAGAGAGGSLEEVLWTRVQRLAAPERALLETVCVAGEPTPAWVLGLAAGLVPEARERAVSTLRVQSLLRVARQSVEPLLAPWHDRVRETLWARLSPARRREEHEKLAQALERWEGAPVESLARHHLAAGDRRQAATYLERAAAAAVDKLAFDRAAELYGAVLEQGDHAVEARRRLMRARADALALSGSCHEAARVYREAATGAPPAAAIELLRLAADNLLRSGHIEAGLVALRESMAAMGVRVPATRRGAQASLLLQRARLALRGGSSRPRAESELSPLELGGLDSLYAASTSLGMIDNIRGADLQSRHLLRALELGEERRLVRALAIDAIFRSSAGGRHARHAGALAADVAVRAERLGDPYLLGVSRLAAGSVAFFTARTTTAYDDFVAAERIFRERCLGADWERVTARFFMLFCRINRGAFAGLSDELDRYVEEADRRNDVYARNLFRCQPSTWRHLCADEPARAVPEVEGALEGWPPGSFYLAHHLATMARVVLLIYVGRHADAAEEIRRERPMLRQSLLSLVPFVLAEADRWSGMAALATGDVAGTRAAIRGLERWGFAAGRGLARLLEAGLAARTGDAAGAARLAGAALLLLEEGEMPLVATAVRHRLGELRADAEGQRLRDEARSWIEGQDVRNVERMLGLLAPPLTKPAG